MLETIIRFNLSKVSNIENKVKKSYSLKKMTIFTRNVHQFYPLKSSS